MKGNLKDCKELKTHTITCLLNEEYAAYEGSVKIIEEYWKKAEILDDFKNLVLDDKRLARNQGYAELSKESDGHWERVCEMLGDDYFYTSSDSGGVLVESLDNSMRVLIPNGYGDGATRIAILENKNFNEHMMEYSEIILEGKMSILDNDCGGESVRMLDGKYFTYYYMGLVAFVKYS